MSSESASWLVGTTPFQPQLAALPHPWPMSASGPKVKRCNQLVRRAVRTGGLALTSKQRGVSVVFRRGEPAALGGGRGMVRSEGYGRSRPARLLGATSVAIALVMLVTALSWGAEGGIDPSDVVVALDYSASILNDKP